MSQQPYKEKLIAENVFLRTFTHGVDPDALVWHTDEHTRIVVVEGSGSGWKIQYDDKMPEMLSEGDVRIIESGTWHRLHKGKGSLKLRVIEMKSTLMKEGIFDMPKWLKASEKMDIDPEFSTVGDLRKLIKVMQSDKRAELGFDGLKDIGLGMLTDLIPGGGTALTIAQTFKGMYGAEDEKKTDTALDKLNIDDEVAAIVDDTVESNFMKIVLNSLDGLDDSDPIPDMNDKLAQWLKSKYDARTVSGYNEGILDRIENKINEAKDQNNDGKNDGKDVRIARMKAGGMSDAEIRKKHPDLFKEYDDKKGRPKQYRATGKRDSQFDRVESLNKRISKAKGAEKEKLKKQLYKLRDDMEKQARNKKGWKNKPRKDTKKESMTPEDELLLREYFSLLMEKKKKKAKKKTTLSKATEEKLRKKAKEKGYTFGSVKSEYRKGLGAFYSSGSRPGMTAHQWAMARVNSATPSKPWAVVKKSKAKKS